MGVDRAIDITVKQRKIVTDLLERHLPNTTAWVYGSRAKWASRPQSDLDLVVFATPEQNGRVSDLREALEESNLPFRVDLFVWDAVPEQFRKQIKSEHVVLVESGERDVVGEWPTALWGELATLEYGKSLRGYDSSEGPYRVYGTNGPIGWHSETLCSHPSVIIGRKGAYRGVHYSASPFFVIDTAFYLKPNAEIDTRWAYYELLTQDINGMDSGSAIPSTSREDFYGLPVQVPPLHEQRAIAHILGTLDDKIELNRRMNETLEAMARALFKSWFVDFDPVRAKMAGRDTGLPSHLADLFPDRMVESELGKIPEGWAVVPLSEIMNFKEGPGIRHWQYTNSAEGTRFINIRCIQDGDLLLSTSNRITTEEADGKYAHFHLKEGDIVVSSSGTLGRSAVVRKAHLPLLLNTSVIRFRPIGGVTSFSYLHGYLNSSIFLDELKSLASGSVQKNVGPTHLKKMRVLFPPYNCIERYEEIAGPFLQKANIKRTDNAALTALRDTLLPRLVSGEVRVDVYDQRIEEAM